ncbi:sulfatase [Pseudomonas sp. MT-1]|nr:sulfatase [Pseudomonas sp. MT-1]
MLLAWKFGAFYDWVEVTKTQQLRGSQQLPLSLKVIAENFSDGEERGPHSVQILEGRIFCVPRVSRSEVIVEVVGADERKAIACERYPLPLANCHSETDNGMDPPLFV